MSGFSDYLKKSLQKEKEELKQKTQKVKKEIFESNLNGYIKKYKTLLNEEDDQYLSDDSEDSSEDSDDAVDSKEVTDSSNTDMTDSDEDNSDDYEKDEEDEEEKNDGVPIATQDESVNVENRQKAIDEFSYGPEKIDETNDDFWQTKKTKFMVKTVDLAKEKLCGNCAAFNIKSEMLKNLDNGIDKEIDENDAWDSDKENRGFCEFLDFKCHKMRTCNSWLEGGPLKDKTDSTTQSSDMDNTEDADSAESDNA